MKMLFRARSAFMLLLILFVNSCKKETNITQYTIPANLQKISTGWVPGTATKAEIYAAGDLYVGYNKVYIALYDSVSNQRITKAHISLTTSGTSGAMDLMGPVKNPTADLADNNGLFDAALIFTQASANWALNTYVQNLSSQKTGQYECVLNVVQATPPRAYSLITQDDSSSLFVSLVQPVSPQLGVNSFELTIYKQISAVNFATDSSYKVVIDAEMPSMSGMNSPNNVNPVYMSNGLYTGKVDFIMDGGWQINISLLHNGVVADSSHYFALSF